MPPKRILMVCLGNICRSPLAEGILRDKARAAGLDWEIDSAGGMGATLAQPRRHQNPNLLDIVTRAMMGSSGCSWTSARPCG